MRARDKASVPSIHRSSDVDNALASQTQPSKVLSDVRPPTAKKGLIMGMQIASLESIFAIFIMIFGDVIVTNLIKKGFSLLSSIVEVQDNILEVSSRLIAFLATSFFIIHQFTIRHNISYKKFISRALNTTTISTFAFVVIFIHGLSTIFLYYLQDIFNIHFYSFDNYIKPDGSLYISRIFELLFTGPIREEIVFRGIIVSYFYTHIGGQDAVYKNKAAMASAIFFGGVHFVNMFSGSLSTSYAWLQVVIGSLVGYLYALRLFNSCLLETVVMHIANNVFAGLLDANLNLDLSNPIVIISIMQSIITYSILCYFSRKQLLSSSPSRFSMVDGSDEEPLPYEEIPESKSVVKTKQLSKKKKIGSQKNVSEPAELLVTEDENVSVESKKDL